MCIELSKGYFYRKSKKKDRNTTLQRFLTLQSAFRSKEETIGNFREFVLEACVARVDPALCLFLMEVGLLGYNDMVS